MNKIISIKAFRLRRGTSSVNGRTMLVNIIMTYYLYTYAAYTQALGNLCRIVLLAIAVIVTG